MTGGAPEGEGHRVVRRDAGSVTQRFDGGFDARIRNQRARPAQTFVHPRVGDVSQHAGQETARAGRLAAHKNEIGRDEINHSGSTD